MKTNRRAVHQIVTSPEASRLVGRLAEQMVAAVRDEVELEIGRDPVQEKRSGLELHPKNPWDAHIVGNRPELLLQALSSVRG